MQYFVLPNLVEAFLPWQGYLLLILLICFFLFLGLYFILDRIKKKEMGEYRSICGIISIGFLSLVPFALIFLPLVNSCGWFNGLLFSFVTVMFFMAKNQAAETLVLICGRILTA